MIINFPSFNRKLEKGIIKFQIINYQFIVVSQLHKMFASNTNTIPTPLPKTNNHMKITIASNWTGIKTLENE